MTEEINISVVESDSVKQKLKKTTKKLNKKYSSNRDINEEKLAKSNNLGHRIISRIISLLLVVCVIFSIVLCFSCLYGKITKTIPTFGGFSYMQVVTGSMTAEEFTYKGETYQSGHKKGDKIVIRSVDTSSLKVGDKIAFYVYSKSFNEFYSNERLKITSLSDDVHYSVSFQQFFGVQSEEVKEASEHSSKLVFHHIIEVFEIDGERWFRTQGSSNASPDNWVIKEDYVIGIYDDSKIGMAISNILGFITSTAGTITMILFPLLLLAGLMIHEFVKNAERAKLELDCVEEKRKINDPICVKHGIGYGMSKKTKYKILAQANVYDWNEYISLLWKNGNAPRSIKKYAIRKNLRLIPIRKKLMVNRACEAMFARGESIENIAKFYLEEQAEIKKYEKNINRKLKAIKRMDKNAKKI